MSILHSLTSRVKLNLLTYIKRGQINDTTSGKSFGIISSIYK
ncbi:hypothetical protein LP2241_30144 [Pseudolactococcus piscium]|nr:hypothetical protein LP2241_30144 [Lactococcus piscium]